MINIFLKVRITGQYGKSNFLSKETYIYCMSHEKLELPTGTNSENLFDLVLLSGWYENLFD